MGLPDAIACFLSKPGAEETTPFGPDVLVYKVGGSDDGTRGSGRSLVRGGTVLFVRA